MTTQPNKKTPNSTLNQTYSQIFITIYYKNILIEIQLLPEHNIIDAINNILPIIQIPDTK